MNGDSECRADRCSGRAFPHNNYARLGAPRMASTTAPAAAAATTATRATILLPAGTAERRIPGRGFRTSPLVSLNAAAEGLCQGADTQQEPLLPAPLFVFHDVSGSIAQARTLCAGLPMPCVGLQIAESCCAPTPAAMAQEYIRAMRGIQAYGPYRLAAYSLGVVLAWHAARILEEDFGESVEYLLALDHGLHLAVREGAAASALFPLFPFLNAQMPADVHRSVVELGAQLTALAQLPAGWANPRALVDRVLASHPLNPLAFDARTRAFFTQGGTEAAEILRACVCMGMCLSSGSFWESHEASLQSSRALTTRCILFRVSEEERENMEAMLAAGLREFLLAQGVQSEGKPTNASSGRTEEDYGLSRHFAPGRVSVCFVDGDHFAMLNTPHAQALQSRIRAFLDQHGGLVEEAESSGSVHTRVRKSLHVAETKPSPRRSRAPVITEV